MNDKQYYPKKMWLLNKVKHFHSSMMVITETCFFLKRKTALWRKCTLQYAYTTNVIKRRRELSQSNQQDSVFRVVFRLIRRQYSKKKWIGHFFLWVSTCEKSQMQTFDLCITGEKKAHQHQYYEEYSDETIVKPVITDLYFNSSGWWECHV